MNNMYEDKAGRREKKDGSNKKSARKQEKEFKPPKKITSKYLYNSGLAYLQRFPASTAHFKIVMRRKIDKSCYHHAEQSPEDCYKLLDETAKQFQEMKLLDDDAYLTGMITSLRRRGLPSRQIDMRLRQKGYDSGAIQQALRRHDKEEYDNENGDNIAAIIFARKKKLGPFDTNQRRPFDKALAMMARAGYGFHTAEKILKMTYEEIEEELGVL